ncbi:MAG: nickel pincer cofactor biosynthesis protein LarC [Cyanobium sp.]
MSLALLDCPTGLAGNMLLAALFDLGLPLSAVEDPLAALGLAGRYRLICQERRSGGLRGLHLEVQSLEAEPPHRHWRELRQQLQQAPLAEPLRQRVLAVFTLLAEAEATVHGHAPEAVHFHEVGALDALVDIVGVCAGLLHFQVDRLVCSPPPAGHGSVATAHGHLPLPAPAVLEIARQCAIPLAGSAGFPPGELTTPTGLALAAIWAERFAPAPAAVPQRVGVGLGSRELDRPNLLRLTLASACDLSGLSDGGAPGPSGEGTPRQTAAGRATQPSLETVLLQQCQIDDASAEDLAALGEALRQAGALEVFSQPLSMKKGRPGTLVCALVRPELGTSLRQVWWRHSTTLGLRETLQQRWVLPRSSQRLSTPLGEVRLKRALLPGGGSRSKIEHDDLMALARRHDLPLAAVRRQVEQHLLAAEDPWANDFRGEIPPGTPPGAAGLETRVDGAPSAGATEPAQAPQHPPSLS